MLISVATGHKSIHLYKTDSELGNSAQKRSQFNSIHWKEIWTELNSIQFEQVTKCFSFQCNSIWFNSWIINIFFQLNSSQFINLYRIFQFDSIQLGDAKKIFVNSIQFKSWVELNWIELPSSELIYPVWLRKIQSISILRVDIFISEC